MDKEIKLYGSIGRDVTASRFVDNIAEAEQGGCKNLTIRVHSGGGSVLDGNVMFNAMQQSRMHIKVIIDGMAASMASIVILAADEVEICENGFIMVHRPHGMEEGDADAFYQTAKLLKDMESNFTKLYSSKTGLSPQEIKAKWLDGKDHWLNADESVKYGFASRKVAATAKGIKVTSENIMSIYNKFVASLNYKNENSMKKQLIDTFKLQGVAENSTDEEVLSKMIELVKKERETAVEAMLKISGKKIQANMLDTYRSIGKTSGLAILSSVLSGMETSYPDITSFIKDSRTLPAATNEKKAVADWTLEDYRRHAPQMLKDNPKLYNELCNKEYGED